MSQAFQGQDSGAVRLRARVACVGGPESWLLPRTHPARLHLDERDHGAVACDQVDLAVAGAKVAVEDREAEALQVGGGQVFAEAPQGAAGVRRPRLTSRVGLRWLVGIDGADTSQACSRLGMGRADDDDGYANNVHTAVPALGRAEVPATIYVTTGPIASQTMFWWEEIAELLSGAIELPEALALVIRQRRYQWRMTSAEERAAVRARLQRVVQPLQRDEIDDLLSQLRTWARPAASSRLPESNRPMTVQELCEIANDECVALGAHTRWHVSLAFQPREVQRAEITAAREDLTDWLGSQIDGFAYPFGIIGSDVSPMTRDLVKRAGYEYAVAVAHGRGSETRRDPYAAPRVVVPDLGAAAFEEWLARQLGD